MVSNVTRDEVDKGQFIERQLVRAGDVVVVGGDFTCVLQVDQNRILVRLERIRILSVNFSSRLTHECLGLAVVIKFQGLGQIILQRIVARPLPRLHDLSIDQQVRLDPQQLLCIVAHAAGLVDAVHLRSDRELLREQVKIEVREPFQRFDLPDEADLFEGHEILGRMREVVIQAASEFPVDLVLGIHIAVEGFDVAEVGREVPRIEELQQAES